MPPLSPRHRRLTADYDGIRAEFSGHPNVTVEPLGAMPPERYRITYRVRSLGLEGDQPVVTEEHVVDLVLPLGYPRVGPVATPRTPVFHPNVDATKYCIADYWSAGQPLIDILRKIGDMLQFRVHNVKSPLNAVAARWVTENEGLLPIGDVDLGTADFAIELRPASAETIAAAGDPPSQPLADQPTEPPSQPLADPELPPRREIIL